MGQLFEVNFADFCYYFQLIKLQEVGKTIESQILLQGTTVTLCKDYSGNWVLKDSSQPILKELVQEIGKSISNMYRL